MSFCRSGQLGFRKAGKKAFTLLEVLLAVALGAFVVTAMTAFLFGMAELWGEGSNDRLFEKHARGVSRFLEHSFQLSSSRYDPDGEATDPIFWMDWEGDDTNRESFLSFELQQSPGALIWPDAPLPHVVCSLDFDEGKGLFLLWRSRLEADFDDDPPRRTLISPFVREVRYHYINYEEENPQWEIETIPLREASDEYVMPERIELVFHFNREEITRQLVLPKKLEGTPIL